MALRISFSIRRTRPCIGRSPHHDLFAFADQAAKFVAQAAEGLFELFLVLNPASEILAGRDRSQTIALDGLQHFADGCFEAGAGTGLGLRSAARMVWIVPAPSLVGALPAVVER